MGGWWGPEARECFAQSENYSVHIIHFITGEQEDKQRIFYSGISFGLCLISASVLSCSEPLLDIVMD